MPNFVVIDENFLGALIKNGYVEIKDLCDVMRHDMGDWLLELAKVFKAETALAPEVEITPDMSASEALNAATDYDGQWY